MVLLRQRPPNRYHATPSEKGSLLFHHMISPDREADKRMLMSLESDNCWDERGGKILGITSYIDVSTDNKQLLFTKVAEGIKVLDEFEKK